MHTQQTTFTRRWLKPFALCLALSALVSGCYCESHDFYIDENGNVVEVYTPMPEGYIDVDGDGCGDIYVGDANDTIEPQVDDAVEPTSAADVALGTEVDGLASDEATVAASTAELVSAEAAKPTVAKSGCSKSLYNQFFGNS